MALKDWKKVATFIYKNKHAYPVIYLDYGYRNHEVIVDTKCYHVKVTQGSYPATIILLDAHFKTQESALKFAKQYMRTH